MKTLSINVNIGDGQGDKPAKTWYSYKTRSLPRKGSSEGFIKGEIEEISFAEALKRANEQREMIDKLRNTQPW